MIAMTTAEGGDDAPALAPPSTHPSRVAPTTTSDNDDKDDGAMNKEVDDGTTTTTMSTTSKGEDNDRGRWATSRKRAADNDVNDNDVAARGTKTLAAAPPRRRHPKFPPPFRRLPGERGRRQ